MKRSQIYVTVDAVVLRPAADSYELLFIKRKNEPFKGKWALPGGFVEEHEDLRDAAARELQEETGLRVTALEQLGAFGKPRRDPRHHTVSVAYIAFVDANAEAIAADDADEAKWFSVKNLPEMAFDHDDIVNLALQKTRL